MPLKLFLEACTLTTRHPFAIARGSSTGYRRCWVRLVDDDGVEGWGEADPSNYYGENYDKYFGPLKLPRGWNELYTKGGLQYPLPWR